MSGFILRIIAMVTMVIDHVGWNFLDNPFYFTWIGRIAFPVYAFLLAEGFLIICKDKNRFIKHLSLLLVLAILSEPGFDILEFRLDIPHYLESQNNIITLLLGFLGMSITELLFPSGSDDVSKKRMIPLFIAYLFLGVGNYLIHGNFNIVGPWLVIAFYWYMRMAKKGNQYKWNWLKRFGTLLIIFVCYLCIYFWVRSGFGNFARWWKEIIDYSPWLAGHALAVLILSFSNGKLGYHEKWFRNIYIIFYPLHIYIIGILCLLLGE